MYEKNQFCKYANQYNQNNIIQQIVSKALVRDIDFKPKTILELGCGSGQVFRYINWNFSSYIAIDASQQMCNLHPKAKNLVIKCFDFDSDDFFDFIKNKQFDMILSSSALQWSKDLDKLLSKLVLCSNKIETVLFTSNTFASIYKITHQKSSVLSLDQIQKSFSKYYECEFEVLQYKLMFDSKKEMFRYIKNSGVSSSSILSYKDAKKLYNSYELDYLEFEVVFIKGKK
jgi:malonyl-CoA O-methyltransferase